MALPSWINDVLSGGLPAVLDNSEGALSSLGELVVPKQAAIQEVSEQARDQHSNQPIQGPLVSNQPFPQSPAAPQNSPAPAMMAGIDPKLLMIGGGALVLVLLLTRR